MNTEQAKSIARWLIATFGGLFIGLGSKHGVDNGTLTAILNSDMFIGVVTTLVSVAWSIVSKTPIGILLAAANIGAVKEIKVNDPGLAVAVQTRTDQAKITTNGR